MIFSDLHPCWELQEFISIYRLRHFKITNEIKHVPKPLPPWPEQCIIFYPRGTEITENVSTQIKFYRSRSIITGQYTHLLKRASASEELMFLIAVFKPGALYRLTGIPSNLLRNQDVDLEAVFPEAGALNARLSGIENYFEMIPLIEVFLLGIWKRKKFDLLPSDKVFAAMYMPLQHFFLDGLASNACLSNRQFERKCQEYLGVCPKLFTRLVRFKNSYDMRLRHPNMDWLSIAISCGYYDYQHMVKDYKKFAMAPPNAFFTGKETWLENQLGLKETDIS
jgi:AraC-like DNA-binding protein